MDSQLKKGLIEYCVLAYLQRGDSYGYQIIKNISPVIPITESTLYPILKRLETRSQVESYSREHNGRLRKYYHVTSLGLESIQSFLEEDWKKLEEIHDYIKGGNSGWSE